MAQLYYTAFTVQSGQVPSTQTDFPVGILLSSLARLKDTSNSGHVANANGYDIRPYSDSSLSSALTYELVYYDPTSGALEMYVKVPSLDDGYVIYLGYGDTGITTDGSSTATWDTGFKAVYHFGGTSLVLTNSAQGGGLTLTNVNTATTVGGPIVGGAVAMASASSQHLTQATAAVTALPITISALAYATNFAANMEICCMNPTSANQSGVDLQLRSTSIARALQNAAQADSATISATTWYHVAGRFASTTDRNVVVNGTNVQNTTSSALNTPNQICVGAFKSNGAASGFMNGRLDELRISNVDRSVNWLTTESNNLRVPSSFYSTGAEQTVGGGSPKNLPPDFSQQGVL